MFDSASEFQIGTANFANMAGTSNTINYFPVFLGGTQDERGGVSVQSAVAVRTGHAAESKEVQYDDILPPSCKSGIEHAFRAHGAENNYSALSPS